jgi:siroheme synthase
MVLFCAGYRSNDCISNIDTVVQILQSGSPAVIYMGLNILCELATALIAKSIESSTPVQILSKISYSNQIQHSTSLGKVSAFLETVKPESPSTVIIGKYVEQI